MEEKGAIKQVTISKVIAENAVEILRLALLSF
jgi:hypothetical protein